MKKYYFSLILLCIIAEASFSQNPVIVPDNVPGAYTDYIYTDEEILVSKDEIYRSQFPFISYTPNINNPDKEDLKLDVYYTTLGSNCMGNKPIIILAHGYRGNKEQWEFKARDLARRGFVVAAINLIHGSDFSSYPLEGATNQPKGILAGAMNLHQAIDYLTNTRAAFFGIDPNIVIVGGGSLGAAVALQGAFASKSEIVAVGGIWPAFINNSYFNQYNINNVQAKIKGVISYYGGLYNLNFINSSDNIPTFMFHGNIDPAVPYNKAIFSYTFNNNPYVYGSGEIAKTMDTYNQSYCFITAKALGHTNYANECTYPENEFPKGYPMNYWPDMLSFIKSSMLCRLPNKIQKTIECNLSTDCDPDVSFNCRVAQSISLANTAPYNTIPVVANLPIRACQPTTTNEHCHAFSFDGGDFIKVNSSSSLNSGGWPINIDFWFKKNGTIPSDKITILYSAGIDNNINNSRVTIGLIGESQLWVYAKDPNSTNNSTQIIPIPTLNSNWHHFAFVTLFNNIKFFIDATGLGIQYDANFSFTPDVNNCTNYFGGAPYTLGTTTLPRVNLNGQLDNIRYMTDIVDPHGLGTDVFVLQTKNDNSCPNNFLRGYWKLNQDGQTIKDETNYHNDGIKGATSAIETSDPTYVTNCNTSARMSNINSNILVNNNELIEKEIIEEKREILSVFPNPSSGKPTVLFISPFAGLADFQLLDNKGTIIINKHNVQLNNEMTILTDYLPNLVSGIYFIKVSTGLKSYEEKFVIAR